MKSIINCIVFALLISPLSIAKAQENESSLLLLNKSLLNNEIISNWNDSFDREQLIQKYNLIHVSQIGSFNYSDVKIVSDISNIVINQDGTNNQMELYKSAHEINQTISQSGDNNFVSDFSLYSGNKINMLINQEGNNLSLFNNGTNSLSKNMQVIQKGNGASVIIFNH